MRKKGLSEAECYIMLYGFGAFRSLDIRYRIAVCGRCKMITITLPLWVSIPMAVLIVLSALYLIGILVLITKEILR